MKSTISKAGNNTKKAIAEKSKNKSNSKINLEKLQAVAKKQKKKTNLLKLCSEMNNYADDANDKEIIKRFKTTITSSVEEDISKISLFTILKKPEDIKMTEFSENIQPYIKHYVFMVNRSLNRKPIKK